jgi:hypothetical protein
VSRRSLVPIVLPGNPTAPLEAAPKQYVDGVVGGSAHLVTPTEPTTPADGLLWTNPDEDTPYVISDSAPRGLLGIAVRTDTTGATGSFSNVLPVTVTVPANRRIRLTVAIPVFCSSGAIFYLRLYNPGLIQNSNWSVAASSYLWATTFIYLTPGAGTYTYNAGFGVTAGTVLVSSQVDNPWTLAVEDVGKV